MITITEAAAAKLKDLLETQEEPQLALRLFITQGGCEGFSYGMAFEAEQREGDQVIERGGVRVLVDQTSYRVLNGAQVDYMKSHMGEGFTVRNPNAISTCGCGHSFKTRQDAGTPEPCGNEPAPQST